MARTKKQAGGQTKFQQAYCSCLFVAFYGLKEAS